MKLLSKLLIQPPIKLQLQHYRIMTILWSVVVLLILFLPGGATPKAPVLIPHLDKFIHFTIFMILTVLSIKGLRPHKRMNRWCISIPQSFTLLAVILFAGASEVVQEQWIPGRGGDIADFIADFLGIFVGVIIYIFMGRIRKGYS